jgi:hypothetical protein
MLISKNTKLSRPPGYAAKEQRAALWSSFALVSLGDWF